MRITHLLLGVLPFALSAHEPVVVVAPVLDGRSARSAVEQLRSAGLDVGVVFGDGVFFGWTEDRAAIEASPLVDRTVGMVEARRMWSRGAGELRLAMLYLAELGRGAFDQMGARAGMDWAGHSCSAHGPSEGMRNEGHERDGRAGASWSCGAGATSERLLGVVVAPTFFVESNGQVDADLYSWSPSAIDEMKLAVIDAWAIWAYTALQHGVHLSVVLDWYEPGEGVPVQGHEPVSHPSTDDHLWIGAIMHNLGRTEATITDQIHGFDRARMNDLGADHAFSTFVAYNPPAQGAPTQFTDGKIAYAVLGGPYVQLLYKANGWSVAQNNRVYGHEVGHVFHAFDEYLGSGAANCNRSFNGRQNLNFQGAPCNGTEACVMLDNSFTGAGGTRRWNMCAHTPVHLGWSGTLPPAQCSFPVGDTLLATAHVDLQWTVGAVPEGLDTWLRVVERVSRTTVLCVQVPQGATHYATTLPNGAYSWEVGQGRALPTNGYAGITGAMDMFRVQASLQAAFTADEDTICPGGSVLFAAQPAGHAIQWEWSFPGGEPAQYSGEVPPPVVYQDPGPHAVTLVVSDGVDADTLVVPAAVVVRDLLPIPAQEDFLLSTVPDGWGRSMAALRWEVDTTATSFGPGSSMVVGAFGEPGPWRTVRFTTPLFDLSTAVRPQLRFRYAYAQATATATEVFTVDALDCDGTEQVHLFEVDGAAAATNGGAFIADHAWRPQSAGDWREVLLPIEGISGTAVRFQFDVVTLGGQDLLLDAVEVFDVAELPVRLLLGGAYDPATDLMRDGLRTTGTIPLQEPYSAGGHILSDGMGTTMVPGVLEVEGDDAIVDWVLVELRDPAVPDQVLHKRAALVQRDGDVVDLDGSSWLRYNLPTAERLVGVKHRNHLGAMTLLPVTVGPAGALVDLSDTSMVAWGTQARKPVNGRAVLWPGDLNGNGQVTYLGGNNDRDPILQRVGGGTPNAVVNGYWPEDFNLDGYVIYNGLGNDRDGILMVLGGNALGIRHQQMP